MPAIAATSGYTMDSINNTMGDAISIFEGDLMSSLNEVQNGVPSQEKMVLLQSKMALFTSLITMHSSITKVYGDTMKQVVTNMGS